MGLQVKRSSKLGLHLILTLTAAFALIVQPMYGLVANQIASAATQDGHTWRINTEQELREALANTKDHITLDSDITLTGGSLLITQPVVIDGNDKTITGPNLGGTWVNGGYNYAIKVYNTSGVVINSIRIKGGNAAMLVNGSSVKLTGNTHISDNVFGGIEVSRGKDLTQPGSLVLSGNLWDLANTETYARPVAWVVHGQGSIDTTALGNAPALTSTTAVKPGQTQYYLRAANSTTKPIIKSISPDKGSYLSGTKRIVVTLEEPNTVNDVRLILNKKWDGEKPNDNRQRFDLKKQTDGTWAIDLNTKEAKNKLNDDTYRFKIEAYGPGANYNSYYGNSSNWTSASYSYIIDNTRPIVTFASPIKDSLYQNSILVSGTATDANGIRSGKITVKLRNMNSTGSMGSDIESREVDVVDGNWSTTFDVSGLDDSRQYGVQALVFDTAGNESNGGSGKAVRPFKIDHTAPTGTFTYSNDSAPTNGNVITYLTTSEPVAISPTGGSHGWEATDASRLHFKHKFTNNGSFDAVITDAAGNTSTLTATVNWIDRTAPTVSSYEYSNNHKLTRDDVTVTVTTSEPVKLPEGWKKADDDMHFTKVFKENGAFYIDLEDLAGNTAHVGGKSQGAEVKRIDRTPPTISGVTDGSLVNTAVTLTIFDPKYQGYDGFDSQQGLVINGSAMSTTYNASTKTYTYTISKDDDYTVVATDKAGNPTKIRFTIDTTAPVVTITPIADSTDATPTITGITEPNTSVAIFIDGVEVAAVTSNADGNWSHTLKSPLSVGSHRIVAVATDAAGNPSNDSTASAQPYWTQFAVLGSNESGGTTNSTSGGTTSATIATNIQSFSTLRQPFATTLDSSISTMQPDDSEVAGVSDTNARNSTADDEEKGEVLAAQDSKKSWSVVNLALSIVTVLVGLVSLAGAFTKRKEHENKHTAARVLTLVPTIGVVVAFFFLENLSLPLGWFNTWSILFGAVLIIQLILVSMGKASQANE